MAKKIYVDKSVYAENNPYGFKINVNNPTISHMYRQFKINHGLPEHFPIPERYRRAFDDIILRMIKAGTISVKKN